MRFRGAVRGVVARSRSIFGTVGASVQTWSGGNISLFTDLADREAPERSRAIL
jgi:hypothetical protein